MVGNALPEPGKSCLPSRVVQRDLTKSSFLVPKNPSFSGMHGSCFLSEVSREIVIFVFVYFISCLFCFYSYVVVVFLFSFLIPQYNENAIASFEILLNHLSKQWTLPMNNGQALMKPTL